MTTMNNRLTAEELKKLRQMDFGKKPGFETAETMLAREVGKAGSPERDEFNAKALAWYYGEVLRDRRKALGITQKELAERVGRDRERRNRPATVLLHPHRRSLGHHAPARREPYLRQNLPRFLLCTAYQGRSFTFFLSSPEHDQNRVSGDGSFLYERSGDLNAIVLPAEFLFIVNGIGLSPASCDGFAGDFSGKAV